MDFEINEEEDCCIICDSPTNIYENENSIWICVNCIQKIIEDGIKFIRSAKK